MSKVVSSSLGVAFARHLRERPDAPALRFKRYGRWLVWTWRAFDREVTALARGLAAAGFRRGGRLWLVGAPSARQLAMLIAAERAGGTVVTLDETSARDELAARAIGAAPEITFVEDRDALDVLDGVVADRSGGAPRVVVFNDPRGLRGSSDARLRSYESFGSSAGVAPELGESNGPRVPEPGAIAASASGVRSVAPGDRALLLPMPWTEGARAIVGLWVEAGFPIGLPERNGSLEADTRELLPTVLLGDASALGALLDDAFERLPRPGTLHRRWLDRSLERRERSGRWGALERELVLRPLRRALGLGHARLVVTVGADPPARLQGFLDALEIRSESLTAASDRGVAGPAIQLDVGSAPSASPQPVRGVA